VTARAAAALLIVLATAGGGHAARPADRVGASGPGSIAGQLLVATESLRDQRFARTVIYMLRHDATGAFGLIVNRPVGRVPLARVLETLGREAAGVEGEIRVHYGGPVDVGRGFVLHTRDWRGDDNGPVNGVIAVTGDPAVFEALGRGAGPRHALFAAGYAGWGPGQLDAEMSGGFWIVVSADESLVFDDDAETKWERATQRQRISL
jgi:putative transcriptional regulator